MTHADAPSQFDHIWDDPWPSRSGADANAWHPVWEEGGQPAAATEPPVTDPAAAAPTPVEAAPGRGGRP